jgi:DNA primase
MPHPAPQPLSPSATQPLSHSAKSRPTVSTPLRWSELDEKLDLGAFTVDTVPDRFAEVGDLWGPAMAEPNNLESLTSRKRIS